MQPQDSLAATRRSLDIEDYIDILRRHMGSPGTELEFAL